MCLLAFPPVRLRAGRQAHRQEGRQVQGFAHLRICLYGNRQACRPFCLQSKGHFSISVSFCGREWLRSCHVFKGLNALPLHPSGRAMLPARTAAPGSVLLLGSRRVSGDRYLYGIVITGISPIRLLRIFVSSKTQQGMFRVTRNLAGYSRKPCP